MLLKTPALAVAFTVFAAGAAASAPPSPTSLPTGAVRIAFRDVSSSSATVFAIGLSSAIAGRLVGPKVVTREAGVGSTYTGRIDLSIGRWLVGVDPGSGSAPWISSEVEVRADKPAEIEAQGVAGSDLSILVKEREGGDPIVRASLRVPEGGKPEDRLLAALLKNRAGASVADGLLRCGIVPAAVPLSLTVEAKGRRAATLKLPEKFEAGTRTLALAPLQALEVHVSGLSLKKGDPVPQVAVARCQFQGSGSCRPEANETTRPFSEEGMARFEGFAPGRYGVAVALPGGGRVRDDAKLSDDSEAPDTFVVSLPLSTWRFSGRTHLRCGDPVAATVKATEFIRGLGQGVAAETSSASDGKYGLKVVSVAGRGLWVQAETTDPKGRGKYPRTIELKESETDFEGIDVLVETGAVEIVLKERGSEAPVPDCPVYLRWIAGGDTGAMMSTRTSDSRGRLVLDGLAKGDVHVGPDCKGYATPEPRSVTLGSDETKEIEFLLDRSDGFRLRVLGPRGQPAVAARVFSLGGLSGREDIGMEDPPDLVGTTSESGEVDVDGNHALRPFFVVSEGMAVGIGRFPTPRACSTLEECTVPITLSDLSPFGGLVVKATSGRVLPAWSVHLATSAGIAIPEEVLSDATRANSSLPPAGGADVNFAPAVLPPGVYIVRTPFLDKGPPRRFTWETRGVVRVPSFEVTTIVVPDPREGIPSKSD
jgi:hypothetical protein